MWCSSWEDLVGEYGTVGRGSMGRLGRQEVKDIRLRFWKVALSRSVRLAQSEFPAGHRTLCFTYTLVTREPSLLTSSFHEKQHKSLDLLLWT